MHATPDRATPMPLADLLGAELVEDGTDRVVVEVTVDERHLNQGLVTHGGVFFTLADTALGLLANPPGAERLWVGTSFSLQLFRGAAVGDVVRATATLEHASRSLKACRVDLGRGRDGKLLGVMSTQLMLAPAPREEDAAPSPSLRRTAGDAPLLQALRTAARREGDEAARADGAFATVHLGEQPCGFVVADDAGRVVATWVHPRWRGPRVLAALPDRLPD